MFDSVNQTRLPKEDRLPDCESRDNRDKKGDRVEDLVIRVWLFYVPRILEFSPDFVQTYTF